MKPKIMAKGDGGKKGPRKGTSSGPNQDNSRPELKPKPGESDESSLATEASANPQPLEGQNSTGSDGNANKDENLPSDPANSLSPKTKPESLDRAKLSSSVPHVVEETKGKQKAKKKQDKVNKKSKENKTGNILKKKGNEKKRKQQQIALDKPNEDTSSTVANQNETTNTAAPISNTSQPDNVVKSKLLVDELKIFQNHSLINQQDPIHNSQIQLNQLDDTKAGQPGRGNGQARSNVMTVLDRENEDNSTSINNNLSNFCDYDENFSTVKKGVLWEHRNYDRLSSKIFGRWKKRYFILTTDYLVCFKRSVPKVGQSEMGKFLYKVSIALSHLSAI